MSPQVGFGAPHPTPSPPVGGWGSQLGCGDPPEPPNWGLGPRHLPQFGAGHPQAPQLGWGDPQIPLSFPNLHTRTSAPPPNQGPETPPHIGDLHSPQLGCGEPPPAPSWTSVSGTESTQTPCPPPKTPPGSPTGVGGANPEPPPRLRGGGGTEAAPLGLILGGGGKAVIHTLAPSIAIQPGPPRRRIANILLRRYAPR